MKRFYDKSGPRACRTCGIVKQKIRADRRDKVSFYYRDENGSQWSGNRCSKCHTLACKKREGRKDRADSTYLPWKKAYDAECLVASFFKRNGYIVEITNGLGPDLTLYKNGVKQTCEVKSVTKSKSVNSYVVDSVQPLRKNDDLMAIVFTDQKILVLPMMEHLLHCNPCGSRCVTKLIQYGIPVSA